MNNKKLMIIAGPCSIDQENKKEALMLSQIIVTNQSKQKQKAIFGCRIVGLKSRTSINPTGKDMGIDFPVFMENMDKLLSGKSSKTLQNPPSVTIADEVIKQTNMLVATEIMSPFVQLPVFEKPIFNNKLLIWNPAVNQLGWPILKMGKFAQRNNWYVGLKNGKWVNMEKPWLGLADYTGLINTQQHDRLILIHRGVDTENKGDFRSLPVHEIAKTAKIKSNAKMFFDPSHTYGPKLRNKIVEETIEIMKMKINDQEYLYDGILIETGTSTTDSEQHITLNELQTLCDRLAVFRDLVAPI